MDDTGDGNFDRGESFVYDGDDVVLSFDETGSLEHRYLHGDAVDQVFASEDAMGEILWPLADNQGTVRDVVDYDATLDETDIKNHIEYDSFGNVTGEDHPEVEFRYLYTSRYFDADSELQYNRARWMDLKTARFLSEDPIKDGLNWTIYVGNSPANYTDPSGLRPPVARNPVDRGGRTGRTNRGRFLEPNQRHRFGPPPGPWRTWGEYEAALAAAQARWRERGRPQYTPTEWEVRREMRRLNRLRRAAPNLTGSIECAARIARQCGVSAREIRGIRNARFISSSGSRSNYQREIINQLMNAARQARHRQAVRTLEQWLRSPQGRQSTENRTRAARPGDEGSLPSQRRLPAPNPQRISFDRNVNPNPPDILPTNRRISSSDIQNRALQADIARAIAMGARDIRVNQQQVNAARRRVGINRPDLQYTRPDGVRIYIEYDNATPGSFPNTPRGPAHLRRIMANDPSGICKLRVFPVR